MPSKLRYALLLPLAALAASCGNSGTSSMTATPNPYTFSGDWNVQLTTTIIPATVPIIEFLGTLSASNGVVTGGLTPIPSSVSMACLTLSLTPVPVSGTVDSSGDLTLTLPVAGGTATLTATLATNVEAYAAGSYKIVGGTCVMPPTPMKIAQYAPISGTYTGTFNLLNSSGLPTTGNATTITAMLTQSTLSNANGQFPVTGTVTATGVCTASLTLTNAYVWGGALFSEDTTFSYNLTAGFDPTGTTTQVALFFVEASGANCPYAQQSFRGTLTRQ